MDTVSIDPRTLHSLAGTRDAPLLLDVRREPAYRSDGRLIAGALRVQGDAAAFAARHAAGRRVVAYCVRGHEVSQDAAAMIRAAGLDAAYLEGGIEAWRAAVLPTIRQRHDW